MATINRFSSAVRAVYRGLSSNVPAKLNDLNTLVDGYNDHDARIEAIEEGTETLEDIGLTGDIIGDKEIDHLIYVTTSTTAATAGGAITITGGAGSTSGVGGAVSLISGAGGATGAGGVTTISTGVATAATSGTAAASGAISITSGAGATATTGTAGATGLVNLKTSTAGAASAAAGIGGASGAITISTGNGGAATHASGGNGGAAGTLTILGGSGGAVTNAASTGGTGAAVSITGGNAGAGSTAGSNGGAVTITGGNGVGTAGIAGNIVLDAGTTSVTTVAPAIIANDNIVQKNASAPFFLIGTTASDGAFAKSLVGGYCEIRGATGNVQMPTAAQLITAIGTVSAGTRFEFVLNAMGSTPMTAANTATVTANTGVVINASVGHTLMTVTGTSNVHIGVFEVIFDSATTCVLSRKA